MKSFFYIIIPLALLTSLFWQTRQKELVELEEKKAKIKAQPRGSSFNNLHKKQSLRFLSLRGGIPKNLIDLFFAETQIEVKYEEVKSEWELFQRTKKSGTDVILAPYTWIHNWVKLDLLKAIHFDKTKAIQNVSADFLRLAFDKNNTYSIPLVWDSFAFISKKQTPPLSFTESDILSDSLPSQRTTGLIHSSTNIYNLMRLYNLWDKDWEREHQEFQMKAAVKSFLDQVTFVTKEFQIQSINTTPLKWVQIYRSQLWKYNNKINEEAQRHNITSNKILKPQTKSLSKDKKETQLTTKANKLSFKVLPRPSLLYIESLMVSRRSKNKANAIKWINFLLKTSSSRLISKKRQIPTVVSELNQSLNFPEYLKAHKIRDLSIQTLSLDIDAPISFLWNRSFIKGKLAQKPTSK